MKNITHNGDMVTRTTKRYVKYPPEFGHGLERLVMSLGICLLPVDRCIRLKKNDRGEFGFQKILAGKNE